MQDEVSKVFSAQVWDPAQKYVWKHAHAGKRPHPFIYECHIGMGTEKEKVGTFEEFRRDVLPRVKKLGYDTLQIMALQEHPYYGSFGYQVSNFYALSSRFGTPEEFKALVDDAHGKGIAVIMDIVHSHSVKTPWKACPSLTGRTTCTSTAARRASTRPGAPAASTTARTRPNTSSFPTSNTGWKSTTLTVSALTG